jgi:2-polyprenyl-3-methyl-5-hydroxy-6-metoxy-1,4-benzoquinol methylase
MKRILSRYAAAANAELIARFEAISSHDVYSPVLNLLPTKPVRMADIGAGTGRDAAWFAGQGHHVLAVEPVEELRTAGMTLHDSHRIEWLDDQLPELAKARATGVFDLITLCAVWQHLDDDARQLAIANLARMTTADGLLIMSLRHGLGADGRQVFPISADETISAAGLCGFELVQRTEAASVQAGNRANGVCWTWLALRKSR